MAKRPSERVRSSRVARRVARARPQGGRAAGARTATAGKPLPITLPVKRVYNYGTNSRVHHCNYFAQPETATFLAETLL